MCSTVYLPKGLTSRRSAEGADEYILSLFPFDRIRPAIIHWEIKNMTRSEKEA